MRLVLRREPTSEDGTFGVLFVDGRWECFTIEDTVRPVKIPGMTAIPAGTYRVIINMSPRFRRRLPLLLDVPGFTGIRIHAGNTPRDTQGCILPGKSRSATSVLESRVAMWSLMEQLEAAEAASEDVYITIIDSEA